MEQSQPQSQDKIDVFEQIADVVNAASKLLSSIESFKEKSTPEMLATTEQCLADVESVLLGMIDSPRSFIQAKNEVKKAYIARVENSLRQK